LCSLMMARMKSVEVGRSFSIVSFLVSPLKISFQANGQR
jgi:hypothetical protein